MNSTIERGQNTSEDQEKSELEYVREQAQAKIDAYLANPELSAQQKLDLLDSKIDRQRELVRKYYKEEQEDLDDYQAEFDRAAGTTLAEQYNDDWLEKSKNEITSRYANSRVEANEIIMLLQRAKNGLGSETTTVEPAAEEPAEEEAIAPEIEEKPTPNLDEPPEPPKEESPAVQKNEKENQRNIEDKIESIRQITIKNREFAKEIQTIISHINSDISNVSPREIYYQPLQRFQDSHISPLRAHILNILEQADNLPAKGNLFQNNNPNAERALDESIDELKRAWFLLNQRFEDATNAIRSLRRRTEDVAGDLDRDNPIMRIGRNLNRGSEEYHNRLRSLFS